jgi:ribonuclease HII
VVGGDALSISIAAASIVAKVTRDRLMERYDQEFPEFGFARHKGYPTAAHREAIRRHGLCAIHRTSFKGVRERIAQPCLPCL